MRPAPSAVSLWLALARRRSVVRRALKTAAFVGVILAAINHGDALIRGEITTGRLLQIALTFLVPYCVSTTSSVAALRERSAGFEPPHGSEPRPRSDRSRGSTERAAD